MLPTAKWIGFPFIPEQASSHAWQVDLLVFFLVAVSGVITLGIAFFIAFFGIRYRKGTRVNRHTDESPQAERKRLWIEIIWSVIPLGIVLIMFVWGAVLYFNVKSPPRDAMDIAVTAKQWMWKFQHPDGRREIDVLHVPLGQAVKLTMTSEDVIHSLFIPAFRIKQDVLPDRYTVTWFRPTKTGSFHLFCTQYCGTNHSQMRGTVVVMEPAEYQRWLAAGGALTSLARQGEQLFQQYGCSGCHQGAPGIPRQGPLLDGLFGRPVKLSDGRTVVADRQYLHDSILLPGAEIVAGFQPLMPTFQGVLGEDQVNALIEYIKTLETTTGATMEAGQ
jgi:cytochrome c oxidase subunit 2